MRTKDLSGRLIGVGLALGGIFSWFYSELIYQIFVLGWWLPIFPSTAIVASMYISSRHNHRRK